MDMATNPFVPGAGSSPPELLGRLHIMEQARVLFARVKAGRFEKAIILTGLRGVGKTVLLNRMQHLARDAGYHSEFIESPEKDRLPEILVPALRRVLLEFDTGTQVTAAGRKAWDALKAFAKGFKVKLGELGSRHRPRAQQGHGRQRPLGARPHRPHRQRRRGGENRQDVRRDPHRRVAVPQGTRTGRAHHGHAPGEPAPAAGCAVRRRPAADRGAWRATQNPTPSGCSTS